MIPPMETLPIIMLPRLVLGELQLGTLVLTSVEVWPQRIVLRAHLLGGELFPAPGPPHEVNRIQWRVTVGDATLDWISALGGGTGAENRIEWMFVASTSIPESGSLDLEWSSPDGSIHGSASLERTDA